MMQQAFRARTRVSEPVGLFKLAQQRELEAYRELGPFWINVNAVAPGFVVTEQSARSRTDPAHVAAVNLRTPMGRWGQPDDIAGPVLFLASHAAGFMTGTCLPIDGGYSIA